MARTTRDVSLIGTEDLGRLIHETWELAERRFRQSLYAEAGAAKQEAMRLEREHAKRMKAQPPHVSFA